MTDAATTTATEAGGSTAAPAQAPAATAATTATLLTGTPATTTTATDGNAAAVPAPGMPEADAAAKAAADAKAAEAKAEAPEKYEAFTIAEGFDAKPEQLAKFGELAKSLNLNQANAQKLVDEHVKVITELKDSLENARLERQAAWRAEAETDKEIGGPKLAETTAYAQRAVQQFGTPELTQLLEETRLGDNRDVLKFFARVGKALGEDTHIAGGVTANPKSMAQRWYGDTMPQPPKN